MSEHYLFFHYHHQQKKQEERKEKENASNQQKKKFTFENHGLLRTPLQSYLIFGGARTINGAAIASQFNHTGRTAVTNYVVHENGVFRD